MRATVMFVLALGLAACQTAVPNSGPGGNAGPGFTDYNTYLRQRAAAAEQGLPPPVVAQPNPAAAPAAGSFSTDAISSAIDAAETGGVPTNGQLIGSTSPVTGAPLDPMALAAERPRGNAPAGITETTSEMTPGSSTISDEQDFNAVKSRETIESDKARIEANRAQYVVVQPGALPVRPGDTGPNIVEFALKTNNPVGVALYDRPRFYLVNIKTACNRYTSPDMAQQAFLAAGGPQRDSKGLDPDGDGFACYWDPRPFRTALN